METNFKSLPLHATKKALLVRETWNNSHCRENDEVSFAYSKWGKHKCIEIKAGSFI